MNLPNRGSFYIRPKKKKEESGILTRWGLWGLQNRNQSSGTRWQGAAHLRVQKGGARAAVEIGQFLFVQTAFTAPWVAWVEKHHLFSSFSYLPVTQRQLRNSVCAFGHIVRARQYCQLLGEGWAPWMRWVAGNFPFKGCPEVLDILRSNWSSINSSFSRFTLDRDGYFLFSLKLA